MLHRCNQPGPSQNVCRPSNSLATDAATRSTATFLTIFLSYLFPPPFLFLFPLHSFPSSSLPSSLFFFKAINNQYHIGISVGSVTDTSQFYSFSLSLSLSLFLPFSTKWKKEESREGGKRVKLCQCWRHFRHILKWENWSISNATTSWYILLQVNAWYYHCSGDNNEREREKKKW